MGAGIAGTNPTLSANSHLRRHGAFAAYLDERNPRALPYRGQRCAGAGRAPRFIAIQAGGRQSGLSATSGSARDALQAGKATPRAQPTSTRLQTQPTSAGPRTGRRRAGRSAFDWCRAKLKPPDSPTSAGAKPPRTTSQAIPRGRPSLCEGTQHGWSSGATPPSCDAKMRLMAVAATMPRTTPNITGRKPSPATIRRVSGAPRRWPPDGSRVALTSTSGDTTGPDSRVRFATSFRRAT